MSPPHDKGHPAPLQRLKRRVFTAVTLFIPVAFLVTLEIALRIFHYGPDISLFTTMEVGGKTYRVMNPGVGKRYFPGTDFTPATSLDAFKREKPPGTYRIFCLGGSTTVGYPYWFNAAFSTFLRSRLHALFPDRSIEVINLGLTATNSFTVLDIARDLSEAGPDLILVYDGHNEFYGALGVASRESPSGARWLTDLSLRLLRFRTYRLVRDLYLMIGGALSTTHPGDERGTMMERLARGENIPMGSRLYSEALGTFRGNLRATAELCAARGIPLILGTQVSNVRTQRPFISLPRPGMTPAETREFKSAFDAGLDALAAGHAERGIPFLLNALALDSLRADAQFALAQSLDSVGAKSAARAAYARARDLDQLRFRASSDFNAAILAMKNGTNVGVADLEPLFAGASADSIVGNELIFEHLHPNARGSFVMAKGYARAMERIGLIAPRESWATRDTISDERLWEERPVSTLDERMAARKVDILTSGWPFRAGVPAVPAVGTTDTLGQIVEMVTRSRWTWQRAHEEALAYYRGRGEWELVEKEYSVIISQTPLDIQPQLSLAHFYMERGRLEEMRTVLASTLGVQPTKLAYRSLGDLALDAGKPAEAIAYYRTLAGFPQERDEQLENGYLLGLAYAQAGSLDSARVQMERLLALKPEYAPAGELLKRLQRVK
jgi:tetratricopeptide (TPR) repeat protein